MANSREQALHYADLMTSVGPIEVKRFFSGYGFNTRGLQFGMLLLDSVYFCVDDSTRPAYIARGCVPFVYDARDGERSISKWYTVPDSALDDAEELGQLAKDAIAVVRRRQDAKNLEAKAKAERKAAREKKAALRAKTPGPKTAKSKPVAPRRRPTPTSKASAKAKAKPKRR